MDDRLRKLISLLKTAPKSVIIQTHDVPDPDAIAAAWALGRLLGRSGLRTRIAYGRDFDKVDARRMVELLGIDFGDATDGSDMRDEDWIVLVDGQAGNANMNAFRGEEVAVVDHHERRVDASYRFEDIRPEVGSCAAMVAEYYRDSVEEPSRLEATALAYGILVDTDGLTRGASGLDADMYHWLWAFADKALIRRLKGSQLTLADLSALADGFKTVRLAGRVAVMRLGEADDSLVGAANDIILSLDEADAALTYSARADGVKLSARSLVDTMSEQVSGSVRDPGLDGRRLPPRADDLVRAVVAGLGVGGGHSYMAGGFIPSAAVPEGADPSAFVEARIALALQGSS